MVEHMAVVQIRLSPMGQRSGEKDPHNHFKKEMEMLREFNPHYQCKGKEGETSLV